jgi:molecular chaperone GrpE
MTAHRDHGRRSRSPRQTGESAGVRKPAGAPEQERRPAGLPEEAQDFPAGLSNEDQLEQGSEPGPAAETDSERAAGRVEKDLEAFEEAKRERDEYLELAQRTKADFENYRKRVAGETEAARRRGKADLAAELVPVLDNLERALTTAGIEPAEALAGEVSVDGALEQGVVLTYRDIRGSLERAGVEAFDPCGEKFDPQWHEALSTRPGDGAEPGVVLDVVQMGYRLDGQLIRAARVVVSE